MVVRIQKERFWKISSWIVATLLVLNLLVLLRIGVQNRIVATAWESLFLFDSGYNLP